jgi:hypothetical protein
MHAALVLINAVHTKCISRQIPYNCDTDKYCNHFRQQLHKMLIVSTELEAAQAGRVMLTGVLCNMPTGNHIIIDQPISKLSDNTPLHSQHIYSTSADS